MKKLRHAVVVVLLVAGLGGCITTNETPVIISEYFALEHLSTKQEVLSKARQALLRDGFQILSSDLEAGYISTSLKNWKLTPEQANCGANEGRDYLEDNYTKTEVAFNVVVDDRDVIVRSNIQGEYLPGKPAQDLTLNCVSRGVIEVEMVKKILL
ncbi:hypothetical protein P3339_18825 [Microbulbifer sp. MLAF003]|uniref:hypothetical protein n=1 Tax=unclassified Microbulbifer TaxID=2619833 RepID=UPI0024AD6BAD|nr:hypothetical protein [Microbulbifer sp. MLAF003]WHI50471.1 hypothetical protein P3339_18825 [Microbulbifer sp. MLAF003]